jgi:hypothetical protein
MRERGARMGRRRPVSRGGDPMSRILLAMLAVALAAPGRAGDEDKGKKPELEVRVTPRFAFSPANLLFTAELKGGDDVEEYYCPEIEWDWGDGDKSSQESDCDPWTSTTTLQRRFTGHHLYQHAGLYRAQVTLIKTGKKLASQTVDVTIRAGLGDTSMER